MYGWFKVTSRKLVYCKQVHHTYDTKKENSFVLSFHIAFILALHSGTICALSCFRVVSRCTFMHLNEKFTLFIRENTKLHCPLKETRPYYYWYLKFRTNQPFKKRLNQIDKYLSGQTQVTTVNSSLSICFTTLSFPYPSPPQCISKCPEIIHCFLHLFNGK